MLTLTTHRGTGSNGTLNLKVGTLIIILILELFTALLSMLATDMGKEEPDKHIDGTLHNCRCDVRIRFEPS